MFDVSFMSDFDLTFESDIGLEAILNLVFSTVWPSEPHLIGNMGR